MPEGQVIASTTDSQEALNAAAGLTPEGAEPQEQPEQSAQSGKQKSAFQKRIDRLVKDREAAKQEVERERQEKESLRQRIAELERGTNGAQPVTAEPRQESPQVEQLTTKPADVDAAISAMRARFTDFDAVMEAAKDARIHPDAAALLNTLPNHIQVRYVLSKNPDLREQFGDSISSDEVKARIQQLSRDIADVESGKASERISHAAYKERQNAAREKYPDFDVVAFRNVPIYEGVAEIIRTHENGTDLQYYLASNPDVAKQLIEMPPAKAMAKAGAIAEALSEEEPQEESNVRSESYVAVEPRRASSSAPAPIRPVGGSATRVSLPLDELPYRDFVKEREKQERNRYRR
jgi:hypothetical protein